MSRSFHLLMPMGGRGSRFFANGYVMPKPLIELRGKPFFYWAMQSVLKFVQARDIICVVLQEHIDQFQIDAAIRRFYPEAKIVSIPNVLNGPVLTCLAGMGAIGGDGGVLVNDCDHAFFCGAFYDFCRDKGAAPPDGGLLTFSSENPGYSYVRYDANGRVCGTVEKERASGDAICGAYYFRNRNVFEAAAGRYLENCAYQEFFVSGVYNEMIAAGQTVRTFPLDEHISFGTPEEYKMAEGNPRLKDLLV